tara:strand:+ start:35546 stop:36643 length:1098 start_codon:yes stop_codon:yes gene_type:complete
MAELDVILYFEEVRKEHLHKYFLLNRELNKSCNSVLMIKYGKGGGPHGIQPEYYMSYPEEYRVNSVLVDERHALGVLDQNSYKIAVFGCGKLVNKNIINFVKNKGITTFQVSKVFGDFYYSGGDVSCYISKLHLACDTAQGFKIPENKIFSNNFLFDNTGEGLPNSYSREAFCEKYSLDPGKDIFVYLPTAIQCVNDDEGAQRAYRKVCDSVDNLILKLHPNEYARWKADRVGYKWSYELYTDRQIPVLDQVDAHWCYTYADCGIAYQSGIGIEFGIYETPFVYVKSGDPKPQGINGPWWKDTYSWVGLGCNLEELDDIIKNKKYIVEDKSKYQAHKEKFLTYPNRHGYEVLSEQIVEHLGKLKL